MKFIELDVIYDKQQATIKLFGKKVVTFKLLYKFLKRILSCNMRFNILFRIDNGTFSMTKSFYQKLKEADFDTLYNNLIKNLDNDSIKTVHRIVFRIKNLYEWKKFLPFIKFFDKDEIQSYEQVTKIWENRKISNNIVTISDKYKFENDESYSALICLNLLAKHGIEKFKNINNIKNKCIIDAGAWIGDSALVLSEATNKNVYSFECTSSTYKLLQRTIELNDKKNIIPVQMGLGDKICQKTLYTFSSGEGNTILQKRLSTQKISQVNSEEINITTIDKFVEENNLEIGFIKADIEGMEIPMLKGAINTLKTQKPTLCISIYHSFDDFFFIKEFLENLNLGYTFSMAHFAKGFYFFEDTCLLAEARINK